MKTCVWNLAEGGQCGKKTAWHMVDDGGEPGAAKVRKYDSLCEKHKAAAKAQKAAEEEWDGTL